MGHKPGVFLDRDGVINQMVYDSEFGLVDSPANPKQFCVLPGVPEAIAKLNQLGFLVVVITNQPGIAKGRFSDKLLCEMNNKMKYEIGQSDGVLDGIYCCLHHPESVISELNLKCDCRKPKPGLLLKAARDLDIDLNHSFMVGDGITDVQAGQSAGVQTLFVSSRKCYICDQLSEQETDPDYIVKNLPEAVYVIGLLTGGLAKDVDPFRFHCAL